MGYGWMLCSFSFHFPYLFPFLEQFLVFAAPENGFLSHLVLLSAVKIIALLAYAHVATPLSRLRCHLLSR